MCILYAVPWITWMTNKRKKQSPENEQVKYYKTKPKRKAKMTQNKGNNKSKDYYKRKQISSSDSSHDNTKSPRNGNSREFTLTQIKDHRNGEHKPQNTHQEVSDSIRKANYVLFDSFTTCLDKSVFEQSACIQKVGTSDKKPCSNQCVFDALKIVTSSYTWKLFFLFLFLFYLFVVYKCSLVFSLK